MRGKKSTLSMQFLLFSFFLLFNFAVSLKISITPKKQKKADLIFNTHDLSTITVWHRISLSLVCIRQLCFFLPIIHCWWWWDIFWAKVESRTFQSRALNITDSIRIAPRNKAKLGGSNSRAFEGEKMERKSRNVISLRTTASVIIYYCKLPHCNMQCVILLSQNRTWRMPCGMCLFSS